MTDKTERSYGQGAQGEIAAPTKTKVSFGTRLRYNFDNSLRRSGAFAAYVFGALIVLSILMAVVKDFIFTTPLVAPAPEGSFIDKVWSAFSIILDKAKDATWGGRIISIFYWIITTAVTATIIGFIGAKINAGIAALKKGRSPIIDSNHTLILGWSNRIFPLLKELAVANDNAHKPLVVIFADIDREQMEDEIAARAGKLGRLRVVTRRGDATNPEDLKRANVSAAKSVIILDSDESGDATVVSTVLAVKSVNANPNLKIIASHGGGTLPYLVGRFEKGDEVELASRRQMKRKPTDYLRHIYYDCITYNPGALQYLISVVGPSQVMFGTDWPHQVHDVRGAFANTALLPPAQCRALRGDNALRVFGL